MLTSCLFPHANVSLKLCCALGINLAFLLHQCPVYQCKPLDKLSGNTI